MRGSIAFLLVICVQALWAQDSLLVQWDDLNFKNPYEQQAFESLKKGNPDYLQLFIGSSGRGNLTVYEKASAKIKETVLSLDPNKIDSYKPKKKIKKIFEEVNGSYYLKYEQQNAFIDVFENGRYNCVSSSAINAMVLEQFNIPYQIIATPDHVYVIAQPQGEPIVMESTDPRNGYIPYTQKVWEAQIRSLIDAKLITEEEAASPQLDSILLHLFPSQVIDMRKLLAIQYYNHAIYDLNKEDKSAALQNMFKANYISPSERTSLGVGMVLYNILMDRNYSDTLYARNFCMYTNWDTSAEHQIIMIDEFAGIARAALQEEISGQRLEEVYQSIISGLKDTATVNEISYYFYAYKTQEALKKEGKYVKSFQYAKKTLTYHPENPEVKNMFLMSMSTMFQYSPEALMYSLDTINRYGEIFPYLREERLFNMFHAETLLRKAVVEIVDGNLQKALKLSQRFEELQSAYEELLAPHELIGVVYSRIALYQFNQSRSTAQQTIAKAKKWAPANSELMRVENLLR